MAVKKDKKIGEVIHFYDHISVAIVKLTAPLTSGDSVKVVHGDMMFTQVVDSMELEHKKLDSAKKGAEIGMKVDKPVKPKTEVFLA